MNFLDIIKSLEVEHAQFYGYPISHSITTYLAKDPDKDAKVICYQESEFVEISVHIPESIQSSLQDTNPITRLNKENLNAYWTLVEELSHFQLLISRSLNKTSVTAFELELQGEVDKLLFSAARLSDQHSDPHYRHLWLLLFEESKIISNESHYKEASNHAAKFWNNVITYMKNIKDPLNSKNLQDKLKNNFYNKFEPRKFYKIA